MAEMYEFTVSNVSADEIDALITGTLHTTEVKKQPYVQKEVRIYTVGCMYAEDTGEKAFLNMPCRGNRIICQCPENNGFISYTKACNPGMCKFFKQKEEELT